MLEMRQGDAFVDGQLIEAGEWRRRLVDRVTSQGEILSDGLLPEFVKLYTVMVPSFAKANAGTAADAVKLVSRLIDPDSKAYERRFQIMKHFDWLSPKCLSKKQVTALVNERKKENKKNNIKEEVSKPPRVPDEVRAEIDAYIEEHPEVLKPGVPSGKWLRMRKKGKEGWAEHLLEEVEAKIPEWPGCQSIMRLRESGCLPIMASMLPIAGSRGAVSKWDRSALNRAASLLSSWESKQHQMNQEREKLCKKVVEANEKARDLGEDFEESVRALAEYFPKLHPRQVRGWTKLRKWLERHPEADEHSASDRVKKLALDARRLGDVNVMQVLASPDLRDIVLHPVGDPVRWLADTNEVLSKLERRREHNSLSMPTTSAYIGYDAPQNANSPPAIIRWDEGDDQMYADIPLLIPCGDGTYEEVRRSIAVMRSGQLRNVVVGSVLDKSGRECVGLEFDSQDGLDRVSGTLGGPSLIVKGDPREKRGTVYISLPIKIELDAEVLRQRRRVRSYLNSSLAKREHPELLKPGALIMAVDLGIRVAAAYSIFQLDENLKPVHVRSGVLRLPGEDPDRIELERRSDVSWSIRRLRRRLGLLSDVRRLASATFEEREGESALAREVRRQSLEKRQRKIHDNLPKKLGEGYEIPSFESDDRGWFLDLFDALEEEIGLEIRDFRRVVKRLEVGGDKSFFRLKHLKMIRGLMVSWDQHATPFNARRPSRGGVMKRLLKHINALTRDRTNTVADLIVQTARGLVMTSDGWVKRYEPVDVIVVDGLSEYKAKVENTPKENAQLAMWAHRAIFHAVEQQAMAASIVVTEIKNGTAYSSRFHSRTGAPGIRCRHITKRDIIGLRDYGDNYWLRKKLLGNGFDLSKINVGVLVPDNGGNTFVTLDHNGSILRIDADVNASRNIGIDYIEGHPNPPMLKLYHVSEGVAALSCPKEEKKRLYGAMRAEGIIFERQEDGSFVETRRFKKLSKMLDHLGIKSLGGKPVKVLRDRSGVFFSPNRWIEEETFWGVVDSRIYKKLLEQESERDRRKRNRKAARSSVVPSTYHEELPF